MLKILITVIINITLDNTAAIFSQCNAICITSYLGTVPVPDKNRLYFERMNE